MDITHDNVCSSMLSCFYSHLLSTGRPISSLTMKMETPYGSASKCGTTELCIFSLKALVTESMCCKITSIRFSVYPFWRPILEEFIT